MTVTTRTATGISTLSGSWTGATTAALGTDDTTYATITGATKNVVIGELSLTTFGFDGDIPAGATITKVELLVIWFVSTTGSVAIQGVTYAISGTPGTYQEDSAEPTTATARTYDVTALRSWTRADLLDAVFTVRLEARQGNSATSVTYSYDYAAVRVTYVQAIPLAAAPAAVSTVAAALNIAKPLAATVGGSSTVAASLTVTTTARKARVTWAELSVPAVSLESLAATVASTSTTSASLSVTKPLAATVGATSTVAAALSVAKPLAATITATSTTTAALGVRVQLAATVTATSTVTAVLGPATTMAASIVMTSTVTATLSVPAALTASVASVSTVTASLRILGPLQVGLAAYWPLDETSGTRADVHGGNDLADNNTVGAGDGKVQGAAVFNGIDEYLSHDDNAALSTGDIDFTLAAWVRLGKVSDDSPFMVKARAGGNYDYLFFFASGPQRFRFLVSPDGGLIMGAVNAESAGQPVINTWYLVIAWHDSVNDTLNIQVNDGTVDSEPWSAGVHDGTAPFEVGRIYEWGYSYLGRLDELGLWKRVLTAGERTLLYNGGRGYSYNQFQTFGLGALVAAQSSVSAALSVTPPASRGTVTLEQTPVLAGVSLATANLGSVAALSIGGTSGVTLTEE